MRLPLNKFANKVQIVHIVHIVGTNSPGFSNIVSPTYGKKVL